MVWWVIFEVCSLLLHLVVYVSLEEKLIKQAVFEVTKNILLFYNHHGH